MFKDKRFVVAILTILLLVVKEIYNLDIDMESVIAAAAVIVAFIVGDTAVECSENCKTESTYSSDYKK